MSTITKILEGPKGPSVPYSSLERTFDSYSAREQEEALRRRAYVDALCAQIIPCYTKEKLAPLIARVANCIGDGSPPSTSSVYRWHQRYIKANLNFLALIPKFYNRGGAGHRIDDAQLEIMERVVQEKYLTLQRKPIREIHYSLIAEIEKANKSRASGNTIKTPGYDTLRRYIKSLPAYDVDLARYGIEYTRKKYRSSSVTPRPIYLLERVEIDHTPLDLFVIDEKSLMALGRPYVTWAIDGYSRQILGFYLSFAPPGIEAVFCCLKHMINNKNYVAERYPDIQNEWPVYGVPTELVVDNGLEFHAQELLRATAELQINYKFCPPRTPWFKPMVERSLRSLAEQFAHLMPGTAFARWFDRYGYDPIKEGVVTMDELVHALHIWIIDVYGHRYHRGLKTTPASAWQKGLEVSSPHPFDTNRLNLVLSQQKHRILGHAGIEMNGLRYNSEEMLVLRKQFGDRIRVQVRFNADDLGLVYAIHPVTHQATPVPCVIPEYAVGLRLCQHQLIQRALQAEGMSKTNPVKLAQAKEHMLEVVGRLMSSTKLSDRKRAAKASGSNSATVIAKQPSVLIDEPEAKSWQPKGGDDSAPSSLPVIHLGVEGDGHD